MNKLTLLLIAGLLATFTWSGPAQAQEEAPGTAAQIILVKPLPGHGAQFEEGVRRHTEWLVEHGAEWSWLAFYISMGERTGQYVFATFNHAFADFDEGDVTAPGSDESMRENVLPHVGEMQVAMIRLRPELSMVLPDAPFRPLYSIYTVELKPGGNDVYEHFLAKIRGALVAMGATEAEYFSYEWVLGGTPGTWVFSFPLENFAAMEEPEEGDPILAMLAGVYGDFEARALMDGVAEVTATEMSELYVLRRDLSINLPDSGGN